MKDQSYPVGSIDNYFNGLLPKDSCRTCERCGEVATGEIKYVFEDPYEDVIVAVCTPCAAEILDLDLEPADPLTEIKLCFLPPKDLDKAYERDEGLTRLICPYS